MFWYWFNFVMLGIDFRIFGCGVFRLIFMFGICVLRCFCNFVFFMICLFRFIWSWMLRFRLCLCRVIMEIFFLVIFVLMMGLFIMFLIFGSMLIIGVFGMV